MLESLFGGKNKEMILLFLFVNRKCYGTQLHHALNSPLTPIQQTLSLLEKSNILLSYYEGKTRLYKFNPSYPLLDELEALLKKAYILLPPQEKKRYRFLKQEHSHKNSAKNSRQNLLIQIWKRLLSVTSLSFHATTQSKEKGGWQGKGKGEVTITKESEHVLIFNEKGSWKDNEDRETVFTNIFRWTLDLSAQTICLEHLRRGPKHPVFLFLLTPSGAGSLSSIDSHLCREDVYFGQMSYTSHHLQLSWRVIGPKKNEELDYFYNC